MTNYIFPSHLCHNLLVTILIIPLIPEGLTFIKFSTHFYTPNGLDDPSNSSEASGEDHKIVGGRPARPGEAPYQLSLMLYQEHHCGATLILSKSSGLQYAITAAHCVTDPETGQLSNYPYEYSVRGGSINRNEGQTLQVANIVYHERWSFKFQYDIALIFFHGKFIVSSNLFPADIPSGNERFHDFFVSGWGYEKEEGGIVPEILRIVKIPLVDINICNIIYQQQNQQYGRLIDNSNICAGAERGGLDACQGDSGGPAAVRDNRGNKLIGIVSFGEGCAQPGIPGVYTRVFAYRQWINYYVAMYERFAGLPTDGKGKPSNPSLGSGNQTEEEN